MKLLSMAKTVPQVRDGIKIEYVNGDLVFPTIEGIRLVTWAGRFDIRDGRIFKSETRRGGWHKEKGKPPIWRRAWAKAKAGDLVELVEWSPRVGARWVCACGLLGSTNVLSYTLPDEPVSTPMHDCPALACGQWTYRKPRRLGVRRIVSADAVRLGDINEVDVIREGFPGMTPAEFVAAYCAPGKPYPDGEVTRLVLARDDGAAKGAKMVPEESDFFECCECGESWPDEFECGECEPLAGMICGNCCPGHTADEDPAKRAEAAT